MKKIICILLCVCMLFSAFSMVCFAGDSEYWAAQKAYKSAVAANNDAAILKAVKQIEAAYPKPSTASEYNRVAFPVQKAAQIYEKQTKYDEAVEYYQKFLKYVTWLDTNTSADYSFLLLSIPAVIEHLSIDPEIYVATSNSKSVPYFGAKNEPKLGTYFGTCNEYTAGAESAFLLYVAFGGESIEDFDWRIPENSSDYILEIAWNLQKESLAGLKEVTSGKHDAYIRRNAEFLSTLEGKVILRFGAEVNCWADNTDHPDQMIKEFKKAYVRVAKVIRAVAPNVALVYSPNAVSNLNVTAEDFYPGDAYVDWVGMSVYQNISEKAQNDISSSDALYGRGRYENMMIKIKPIIDAFGGKKPIMISECGFAHESADGLQTQAHAAQKLKEFYSYVNCVYPQVKLVLYFDVERAPVTNDAYALEGNAAVLKAYNQSVAANAAMQSTLPGNTPVSYTKIDQFSQKADQLDLKIYASFPSHKSTAVTVTVDGKKALSSSSLPYSLKLNTKKWAAGIHTIKVVAKSGNTTRTIVKCLEKTSAGLLRSKKSLSHNGSISAIKTQTYSGKALKPAIKVTYSGKTLKNGTDYTVTYKNNTKLGTATVTVRGKGAYCGEVKKTFKIVGKITSAKVSGITAKVASGKAQVQSPKVVFGGKTLKKGTDYTLSYKNNIKAGKATLKIIGKGSYIGTITKTFIIKPAKVSLTSFRSTAKKKARVAWKKSSGVSGYQVVYAANSKFTSGKKSTLVSASNSAKTISGLKSKKTYYVKVRAYKVIGGKRYYGAFSAAKKVRVK